MSTIAIIPIPGIAQIRPGDDLPSLLLDAIDRAKVGLKSGDILVLCQKIVSKAEGAVVDLKTVEPSPFARQIATMWEKDPRLVEVVLRESNRIIRMKNGVVITETKQGWVFLACPQEEEWHDLCAALSKKELLNDPRFSDATNRKANDAVLATILSEAFQEREKPVAGLEPRWDWAWVGQPS